MILARGNVVSELKLFLLGSPQIERQGQPLPLKRRKAIADEIEANLDFLATSQRQIPARHRSLRAVFDYSWQQLSADEQTVFSELSVFRGGCTREAAQAVAGASLQTLLQLLDKSLLRRTSSGRYEIHELLRQYGEEALSASPAEQT